MELASAEVSPDRDDHSLLIGLRNSHDQSFAALLCVGGAVFVFDNLSFSGEVVLARRHTRFIVRDLPELVNRAVGQLGELRFDQAQRIANYRDNWLAEWQAHNLLVRMLDSKVLPVIRLPKALEEFRTTSHAEFLTDGKRSV